MTAKEEKEIRPCPFCGSEPELIQRGNQFTKKRSAEIFCKGCRAIIVVGAIRNNLEWCVNTVVEKWNTRHSLQQSRQEWEEKDIEAMAANKFPIDDSMPENMRYNQGSKQEGFIAGYKAALKPNEWVSVVERLPKVDGFYNVYLETDDNKRIHSLWFRNNEWCFDNGIFLGEPIYTSSEYVNVIKWQPLPLPPKP